MKKIVFLCAFLVATGSSALASDRDFPRQLEEINYCYKEWGLEHLDKITDAGLRKCMREHGYAFCKKCKVDDMVCGQTELGSHHPDCYRLAGRVSDKGYPIDDGPKSNAEKQWDDIVYGLTQKWYLPNSACHSPIVDERKCDAFKMTEEILRDHHCKVVTKETSHWECPRFKDLPEGD